MEVMLSVRGKKLIIVDKYTFRKERETVIGVSYRCTNAKCPARIAVDKTEEILLEKKNSHNHSQSSNIDVKKLQNGIKRKAVDDLSERPSKILSSGIKEEGPDFNITMKDLENIKKSMYRARRKVLPSLPRSVEEVHDVLQNYSCETNKNEEFLIINDKKVHIIIFSCMTNLKYLCSQNKIYVDGTFNYCTKFFTQLFTIHTVENGNYIPLVFILLQDKKAETYFQAFQLLKSHCASNNLLFNPNEIVNC